MNFEKINFIIIYLYNLFINLRFTRALIMIYTLSLGISVFEFGLIQSIYSMAKFSLEIPSGIIADKFKRKTTLASSAFLAFFVYLLLYLIKDFESDYLVFIISILFVGDAFSFALNSGTDQSLLYEFLARKSKKETFAFHLSRIQIVSLISLSLATILGGVIAKFGIETAFLFQSFIYLSAGILISFIKEPTKPPLVNKRKGKKKKPTLKNFLGLSSRKSYLILIMVFFGIIEANINTITIFSQGYFDSIGVSIEIISLLIGATTFLGILGAFFAPYFSRLKFTYFMIISSLIFSLSILLFSNNKLGIAILGFSLLSILYDLIIPKIFHFMNEQVTDQIRASVLSIMNFISSLLALILNVTYGKSIDGFGYQNTFFIGGLISFFILLAIIWITLPKFKHLKI